MLDVYALRDLVGHCYVHFAFVFTLTMSSHDVFTPPLEVNDTRAGSNYVIVIVIDYAKMV